MVDESKETVFFKQREAGAYMSLRIVHTQTRQSLRTEKVK